MNILVYNLRNVAIGNALGMLILLADIWSERVISNRINRRIAMYIFHMLFALPAFILLRHDMRYDKVNSRKESQADTQAYILSFFSVGLGLYFGYALRGYLEDDVYGK